MPKTPNGAARAFFDKAMLTETDECILWPFSGRGDGRYGAIRVKGQYQQVHRVVCAEVHGSPPSEKHEAGHSCGKTRCINRRHLRWVTPLENAADKFVHGTVLQGEQMAAAKLTEDDVRLIRKLRETNTLAVLAKRFGVSITTIAFAASGRAWRCVK